MTNAARWNLQMGVPENKMYEHTNYTSDGSALPLSFFSNSGST